MRPIYPSLKIELPADWCLMTSSGTLHCEQAELWIETHEKILPPDWASSKDTMANPARHQLRAILLRFQGTESTWKKIQAEHILGYQAKLAGPIFGGSFEPTRQYFFEADLRSSPLTLLSLMNDHLANLKNTFLQGSIAEELRQDKSYRLLNVLQTLPSNPKVQMGMTLNWTTES